jgi:hypothetical protein
MCSPWTAVTHGRHRGPPAKMPTPPWCNTTTNELRRRSPTCEPLIEGTVSQTQLIGWKQNHMGINFERTTSVTLGKKYWENICRWNAIEKERKKAVKFNSKRDDWCTKENFAAMYYDIYKMVVRAFFGFTSCFFRVLGFMPVIYCCFLCVHSVESFDINCACTSSVRKIVYRILRKQKLLTSRP